jgi:hypothetical protein
VALMISLRLFLGLRSNNEYTFPIPLLPVVESR